MRIAVLGSGFAGSFCAFRLSNRLAERCTSIPTAQNSIEIAVFEMGRGAGGRSSSRRPKSLPHSFDYGAQYFYEPYSKEYTEIVDSWIQSGIVAPWNGNFATIDYGSDGVNSDKSKRFVGIPSMNSIQKHLLSQSNFIKFRPSTQAIVSSAPWNDPNNPSWRLRDPSGADLGTYDWLVCTDRAALFRPRPEFQSISDDIQALVDSTLSLRCALQVKPSLCTMLVVNDPNNMLQNVWDSLEISNHDVLQYIAKDSSKPQRSQLNQNQVAFVIHSTSSFAESIIKDSEAMVNTSQFTSVDAKNEAKKTFVRERANDILPKAFAQLVQNTLNLSGLSETIMASIVHCESHRWGAAFPDYHSQMQRTEDKSALVPVFPDQKLAFCGDFCDVIGISDKLRTNNDIVNESNYRRYCIENAVLSGQIVADSIVNNMK